MRYTPSCCRRRARAGPSSRSPAAPGSSPASPRSCCRCSGNSTIPAHSDLAESERALVFMFGRIFSGEPVSTSPENAPKRVRGPQVPGRRWRFDNSALLDRECDEARAFARLHAHEHVLLARMAGGVDCVADFSGAVHRLAADIENDVAGLESSRCRRAVWIDVDPDNPVVAGTVDAARGCEGELELRRRFGGREVMLARLGLLVRHLLERDVYGFFRTVAEDAELGGAAGLQGRDLLGKRSE